MCVIESVGESTRLHLNEKCVCVNQSVGKSTRLPVNDSACELTRVHVNQ